MKRVVMMLVVIAASSLACSTFIFEAPIDTPMPTVAIPTNTSSPTNIPEPTATSTPVPTATPSFDQSKNGTVVRDIIYCIVDGIELKMDVYYPQAADGPWPVAVYVHGGSFTKGSKQSGAGIPFVQPLVDAGYLVVAINYRLAPEYPFPAPIEDVKCAIRSLRANAFLYNIDVNRIGAFGGSAGGQLVSLMGVTDASAGLDTSGGYLEESSRVQAVVPMAGISDVTLQCNSELIEVIYAVIRCQDIDTLIKYSPITYVSADDPPFLLLHSEFDIGIPPLHAELIFDKLYQAGVQVTFFKIQNAEHVFKPTGGEMQPSMEELIFIVISFFNNVLK